MILLKQKSAVLYVLPPPSAPEPPSPWSNILWGDDRRHRPRVARGTRVMQLRNKVIAKVRKISFIEVILFRVGKICRVLTVLNVH